MLKRYLVFTGEYCVIRAWECFRGSAEDMTEALNLVMDAWCNGMDWYQIIDSETGHVVREGQKRDEYR